MNLAQDNAIKWLRLDYLSDKISLENFERKLEQVLSGNIWPSDLTPFPKVFEKEIN